MYDSFHSVISMLQLFIYFQMHCKSAVTEKYFRVVEDSDEVCGGWLVWWVVVGLHY